MLLTRASDIAHIYLNLESSQARVNLVVIFLARLLIGESKQQGYWIICVGKLYLIRVSQVMSKD